MTSELSFLIDLLLNHKLSKPVRDLIADRIKEVETRYIPQSQHSAPREVSKTSQAASTLALLAKHQNLPPPQLPQASDQPSLPVEQIAQTPEAVKALTDRAQAINDAVNGRNVMRSRDKMERTSPRKW